MYRLLIADDEAFSRYVFSTFLTREFKNIDIVGEAESGREAVELNRKLRPDIVIMDIKMPGINGIEASKQILGEYPDSNILILTAYDNFEYVKKAIDIGIKGYLLKPIQREEVIEKINKLISYINTEENKSNVSKQVEKRIKLVKPVIQKELINSIISGSVDADEAKSYLNFLHEEFEAGYFIVISIEGHYSNTIHDFVKVKLTKEMVYNYLENRLALPNKFLLGNSMGNKMMALFPLSGKLTKENVVRESIDISNEIKKKIKINTGIEVAISIGNPYEGITNLKKSYDEANKIIKIALNGNRVIHCNNEKDEYEGIQCDYPIELEKELLDQIKIGNIEKSKELLNDIIEYSFCSNCDMSEISEIMLQLITMLKRTSLKMGVKSNKIKNLGTLEELKNIYQYDELKTWFKNSAFGIIDYTELVKKSRDVNIMEQIHIYLNSHFNKDISLDMVSEKIGLSPQYFSKIFKEGYGINFIDYITDMRLNYSKVLLNSSDKSINEISSSVGYSDANYFCRIFKKNIGITPGQYRSTRDRKI